MAQNENYSQVDLRVGTEEQFNAKVGTLPAGTLFGTTDSTVSKADLSTDLKNEINDKINKPANPSADSAIVISSTGAVSTKPLTSITGKSEVYVGTPDPTGSEILWIDPDGTSGTSIASKAIMLCSNNGNVKLNAGSNDEYILPTTEAGVPKFKLGSGNFKFEEIWSKSFHGDLDGTATNLKNKYLHFITIYLYNAITTGDESACISFSFLDDQAQAYGNDFATKLLTTGSKCISGNGIIYESGSYISFTQLSYTPGNAGGWDYTAKVFGNSEEKDKTIRIQTAGNNLRVVDIVSKIN